MLFWKYTHLEHAFTNLSSISMFCICTKGEFDIYVWIDGLPSFQSNLSLMKSIVCDNVLNVRVFFWKSIQYISIEDNVFSFYRVLFDKFREDMRLIFFWCLSVCEDDVDDDIRWDEIKKDKNLLIKWV